MSVLEMAWRGDFFEKYLLEAFYWAVVGATVTAFCFIAAMKRRKQP